MCGIGLIVVSNANEIVSVFRFMVGINLIMRLKASMVGGSRNMDILF
jgi:hypothetical protein